MTLSSGPLSLLDVTMDPIGPYADGLECRCRSRSEPASFAEGEVQLRSGGTGDTSWRGDIAMQALPELLTKTLDREWPLPHPVRIEIKTPPMETPEDEALRPMKRPKIGRAD